MKQSFFRTSLLSAAMVCAAFSMSAVDKPTFWVPNNNGTPLWTGMSDNGKWGVADIAPSEDGSINPIAGVIYNVEKRTQERINPAQYYCMLFDITDDGKMAVGTTDGAPAYYNVDTKSWKKVPGVGGTKWTGGRILKVTPDGKYGVGFSQPEENDWGNFYGTMWDLEKNEVVQLGENAPYLDSMGQDPKASKISSVSPDGRWLVFEISWYQDGGWCALYDRIEDKVYPLGLKMNADGTLSRDDSGYVGCSEPYMSNDGKYLTGNTQTVQDMGQYDTTADYAFLYDIEKHEMKVYAGSSDSDVLATAVLNDGTVLACQPVMNPARELLVRHGNYFYPMSEVYSQAYGINLERETNGVGIVTGTPLFVSNDGRTWLVMATANLHDCYLVTFPESIDEACNRVNLLNNYTVTPASGTTFSELSVVNIVFDRPISITGAARHIRVVDNENNPVAQAQSVKVVEKNKLTFNFRPTMLEPGKTYTITLPEGFVVMEGDVNMKAKEIKIEYKGRGNGRIEMTEVTPKDGTMIAEFSMGTSPITLTFDTDVAINEANYGALYRSGSDEVLTNVLLRAYGRQVIVYPAVAQHFYKGYSYKIVIPENSITDLSGNGGNEEFTLQYEGTYVNNQGPSKYIWHEAFGDHGYEGLLFYEGDHLEPGDVPFSWGFEKDTTPWLFLRSGDDSDDWCIGSHSMYDKPGKSDDWFTSKQLYIPDSNCFLRFEAQSYLNKKDDHLKVYILATDDIYQYADKAYIDRMRNEGEMIADLKLEPGKSQEGLEGDWVEYTFDLEKYAEKNIYIGFCNENEDQSAIFVDNVVVEHDLSFFTSFTHEEYVTDQESILIEPVVSINSALSEFTALDAILLDKDNKEIDSYSLTGQDLKEGDVVEIKFMKKLPLEKGKINDYTLQVSVTSKSGEVETGNIQGQVYNLLFAPKKHIVVEEYSGRECANCPLGIAAMNNLEKTFGSAIIPVVLRCYNGDVAGNTVQNYNAFLGLTAAPSARLNRGEISNPMVSVNGDYMFTGRFDGTKDHDVWFDVATDEMKVTPLLEVTGKAQYNDDKQVLCDFTLRAAIDMTEMSIGVFAVLLEDKVMLAQMNNFYNTKDDDLLPWSVGGEYAKNLVVAEFNDIARAAYGDTYYGSLGLIPSTLKGGEGYPARVVGQLPVVDGGLKPENCKVAFMAINTATGMVLDASVAELIHSNEDGVNNIGDTYVSVTAADGKVNIAGVQGNFTAEVYTLDGSAVANVSGNGETSIDVPAGLVIVRVNTTDGTLIRKFIVR